MERAAARRIRIISLVIMALAVLFWTRLFFIQVIKGKQYTDQADRQYSQPQGFLFDRGAIYFTEKDGSLVSAATLKTGFLLALNPSLLTQASSTYVALNSLIPLEQEGFMKKALKTADPYEEVANHLEKSQADAILALKLPGVFVYKERWRFYPAGRLAAHVIGLMGYKGDDYLGRYGLEKYYNELLSRDQNKSFINFFAEIFSELGEPLLKAAAEPTNEGDLVLTIEPTVEDILEKELKEIKTKWQAQSVGGIIINPQTGEILALAARPDFDPGGRQTDLTTLSNPLVEDVYEMGSIIKPLTLAAALDAGVITAQTTYNDLGYVRFSNAQIANYDGQGRGVVSMQEVLNQSLNTGAVFAMQRLGRERFGRYMLNYGLGEKTGIDLPNEVAGLVDSLSSTVDVEYATAAFGQGIALSPIATVRALSSLGNGGVLVQPHLVKNVRYTTKLSKNTEPETGRRVLKPETSEEISRMLVKVVDGSLAGGRAKMEHYNIAAKTGTAQIADKRSGGYYEDRFMHTFFGYFPAYDPKFLVFLYAREPQGVRYASETLTDPFINLTKFLINYYDLPPDR